MAQQLVSRTSSGSFGTPASAPVRTAPTPVTIAPGDGSTPLLVYTAALNELLPKGGVVIKSSECDRLKISVSYLDGGNCAPGTAATLKVKTLIYYAEPGGGGYDLKDYGFVTKVEVTVVNASGVPTDSVLGCTVRYESERAAECNEVRMPVIAPVVTAFNVKAVNDATFLTLLPASTTFDGLTAGADVGTVSLNGNPIGATTFVVKADGSGIMPQAITPEFSGLQIFQVGNVFTFVVDALTYTLTATQI